MTVRELAQLAGVSPATVSIVLNGKKGVSDKTRKSVLELAEKYEYVHTRTKSIQNDDKNIVLFLKFRKHGMLVEEVIPFPWKSLLCRQIRKDGYN